MVKKRKTSKTAKKVARSIGRITKATSVKINKKYNLSKKVKAVKYDIIEGIISFKKEIIKTVVEVVLLITGILSLIVGLIIFLAKRFPIENILILYGVIVTIVTLLLIEAKPK